MLSSMVATSQLHVSREQLHTYNRYYVGYAVLDSGCSISRILEEDDVESHTEPAA